MSDRMQAVTYQGLRGIKVKEVEAPRIMKQDDLILRVTSTSICGSDLHIYRHRIPHIPKDFVIGHEAMGIVEEIGSQVTAVKKGDRVIDIIPIEWTLNKKGVCFIGILFY